MPPRGRMAVGKPKNTKATLRRVLSYLLPYKRLLALVVVGIVVSAARQCRRDLYAQAHSQPVHRALHRQRGRGPDRLCRHSAALLGIYAVGGLGTYMYSRLMVQISTGTLNRIRKDLFEHMEDLPIRYFDTHTHGELMSRYTNDTDTLREMLTQSMPQMLSAIITVSGTFIMMLVLSPPLMLLVFASLALILFLIRKIGGRSSRFFLRQQKSLGALNGYIEEMIEGQKVVKVFNHEEEAKADFDRLNEDLCQAATNAHTFASILMPIMGNMSHVHYAVTAAAGAGLIIAGWLDIGSITAFLQYTRSFFNPITQMSQQFNAILMALAGAERIFEMIDEPVETDEGYVELVNAERLPDGSLRESERRTACGPGSIRTARKAP